VIGKTRVRKVALEIMISYDKVFQLKNLWVESELGVHLLAADRREERPRGSWPPAAALPKLRIVCPLRVYAAFSAWVHFIILCDEFAHKITRSMMQRVPSL
jgi:hypothetical protein